MIFPFIILILKAYLFTYIIQCTIFFIKRISAKTYYHNLSVLKNKILRDVCTNR